MLGLLCILDGVQPSSTVSPPLSCSTALLPAVRERSQLSLIDSVTHYEWSTLPWQRIRYIAPRDCSEQSAIRTHFIGLSRTELTIGVSLDLCSTTTGVSLDLCSITPEVSLGLRSITPEVWLDSAALLSESRWT